MDGLDTAHGCSGISYGLVVQVEVGVGEDVLRRLAQYATKGIDDARSKGRKVVSVHTSGGMSYWGFKARRDDGGMIGLTPLRGRTSLGRYTVGERAGGFGTRASDTFRSCTETVLGIPSWTNSSRDSCYGRVTSLVVLVLVPVSVVSCCDKNDVWSKPLSRFCDDGVKGLADGELAAPAWQGYVNRSP